MTRTRTKSRLVSFRLHSKCDWPSKHTPRKRWLILWNILMRKSKMCLKRPQRSLWAPKFRCLTSNSWSSMATTNKQLSVNVTQISLDSSILRARRNGTYFEALESTYKCFLEIGLLLSYFFEWHREAWNKLGDMSQIDAMKRYSEEVHKVLPSWDVRCRIILIVHFRLLTML